MNILRLISFISFAIIAGSCTKDIDKELVSNERSVLELKLYGQLGNAIITREGQKGRIEVYILDTEDFPYANVDVEGIVVSAYGTATVDVGSTLDFYNPERKAKITVTSESGYPMDWTIYLIPYNAFYTGTWKIEDIKIYVDQNISGSGAGKWDTQMNGSEFGYYSSPEYDNIITVEMNPLLVNGEFTGTIVNDMGVDGTYGSFMGIYPGEYTIDDPLDMNSRLRHLIPQGESTWVLNLSTNVMKITKNNITSTMTFSSDNWGNTLFDFALPNASGDPAGSNFYNNFWRSSYKFSYILKKIN